MSIAHSCKIGVQTNGLRSRNTVVVPPRRPLQSVSSWGLNVRDVARIDAVERLAALASLRSLEIYDAFAELVGQAGRASECMAELRKSPGSALRRPP